MPARIHPLRISVRRTFRFDAQPVSEARVDCPQRGDTVALADCAACGHAEAMDSSFVWCDAVPSQVAEPAALWKTPVVAIMAPRVVAARPETPLSSVMALFVEHRIGAAPVVDADGALVGIVTKSDVVQRHFEDSTRVEGQWSEIARVRASDLTPSSATLELELECGTARATCATNRRQPLRIQVIRETGELVATYSSAGIVRRGARLLRGGGSLVRLLSLQLESFTHAARGKQEPVLATAVDGLAVMAAVDASRSSADDGGIWRPLLEPA